MLNALLQSEKSVNNNNSQIGTNRPIMWLSPIDAISTAIVSTDDAIKSGLDTSSAVENAVQQVPWNTNYTQQIATEKAKDSITPFRNIKGPGSHFKYMLRISPIVFPAQVAACPSLNVTEAKLSSEQFIINICDFSGRNIFTQLSFLSF